MVPGGFEVRSSVTPVDAADLDLVYVATRNRIVFGSEDLAGLRDVLARAS
jgi:hypothetical protein